MAYRAVFELTESASCKVESVLDNIRHLQEELGPAGLEVELVAHSDGIAALLRGPDGRAAAIEQLAAQGVRFAACQTTMAGRGLTADDVLEVAQIVPSGVGELVRRQAEGWAYVRP